MVWCRSVLVAQPVTQNPMQPSDRQIVAIFDLDRTITRRPSHLAFYSAFLKAHPGKWPGIFRVVAPLLRYQLGGKDRKKLKEAFLQAFLAGRSWGEVDMFAQGFADAWLDRHANPGALERIAWHKGQGHVLVLATASYHLYVDSMAQRLGFDHVVATRIDMDGGGRITGRIDGANCWGAAKRDRVSGLLAQYDPSAHSIFYSDELADLPLLQEVDEPHLVNPDDRARRHGERTGIPILDWR